MSVRATQAKDVPHRETDAARLNRYRCALAAITDGDTRATPREIAQAALRGDPQAWRALVAHRREVTG